MLLVYALARMPPTVSAAEFFAMRRRWSAHQQRYSPCSNTGNVLVRQQTAFHVAYLEYLVPGLVSTTYVQDMHTVISMQLADAQLHTDNSMHILHIDC